MSARFYKLCLVTAFLAYAALGALLGDDGGESLSFFTAVLIVVFL